MRKDLLEDELNTFVGQIKRQYRPQKIILFGSLASGRVSENSDLDVIVVAETKEPFWARLTNISKYCSRKVGMDILIYTPEEFAKLLQTRTFFKREIAEKGKIIYDQTQSA